MISRNDRKHVRKDKVHLLRFVTGCFLFHSLLSTFKTEIGKTAQKSLQYSQQVERKHHTENQGGEKGNISPMNFLCNYVSGFYSSNNFQFINKPYLLTTGRAVFSEHFLKSRQEQADFWMTDVYKGQAEELLFHRAGQKASEKYGELFL